jgi:hypothetical protein
VACLSASSCPGSDTECHHRTCTAGVCGVANTADGTALVQGQTGGDCKKKICMGGNEATVNDDADKPVDGNACTSDVCTSGAPSNPNLSVGDVVRNQPGLQRPGRVRRLRAGVRLRHQHDLPHVHVQRRRVCGISNAAAGTVLPPAGQTANDCKRVQCDGQGQTTTVTDDTDKPVDGNACTKDVCSGGIVSNPPEDAGTACAQSNGKLCNGSGTRRRASSACSPATARHGH